MHRIILLDDEPNILRALERLLNSPTREIESFTDPELALQRAYTATFDLALADYRMPGMDGLEFLVQIKQMQPDVIRLILSGYGDLRVLVSAINEAEIYRFISKPWDNYDLEQTVAHALKHRDILVENRRLAVQVRQQQQQLSQQEQAMLDLEQRHPDIARVTRNQDGSIVLEGME